MLLLFREIIENVKIHDEDNNMDEKWLMLLKYMLFAFMSIVARFLGGYGGSLTATQMFSL